MTDKRFADRFGSFSDKPQLVKAGEPVDDEARPATYQAIRRIHTFRFSDVVFRYHNGAAQAFPSYALRTWLADGSGRRLTLIWPEGEVSLTGRHLDQIEEPLMRRIVAEFRQVPPFAGNNMPEGVPVIETMEIRPLGIADEG